MSLKRLSCFSIISAIESDMRSHLVNALTSAGVPNFLADEVREITSRRRLADKEAIQTDRVDDFALVEYLDFGDLAGLLGMHKSLVPDALRDAKDLIQRLSALAAVRNRVCHSRPLEVDDYQLLHEFADYLTGIKGIEWPETKVALRVLSDNPGATLRFQIPEYWKDERAEVFNNLPSPDFDDTGFIGRKNDVASIKKLVLGPYPVISVIGEGGVGKTSVTLKALYELLEEGVEDRFDAIAWVSLKASVLTASGVMEIRGALSDAFGMYSALASALGSPLQAQDTKAVLAEVKAYLAELRVLLAIDNLESLPQSEVIDFLKDIPLGSKVLITSRIGLGQLEHPFPLAALSQDESVKFMRLAARVQNQAQVYKAKAEIITKWCQRLLFNPLAIKWFIASVAQGASPESIVARHGTKFSELLKFSFTNLYESLPGRSKQVVSVVAASPRSLSRTEISALLDAIGLSGDPDEVESDLRRLVNASVMQRSTATHGDATTVYTLSPFAREYTKHISKTNREVSTKVTAAIRELRGTIEANQRKASYFKYEVRAAHGATNDENIIAIQMLGALRLHQESKTGQAIVLAERALRAGSEFAEVRRLAGVLAAARADYVTALDHMEAAVEIAPDSAIARYCLARLMLYDMGDLKGAAENAERIAIDHPNDTPPRALLALIRSREGHFSEASKIYESVVDEERDLPSRHRVPRVDQLVETYRRWAEEDARSGDWVAFIAHINLAFSNARLLSELAREGDPQTRTRIIETLCVLVNEAARRREVQAALAVIAAHEGLLRSVKGDGTSRVKTGALDEFRQTKHYALIEQVFGVAQKFKAVEGVNEGALERRLARVRVLAPVGSYGFLQDSDGRSWFFHRNHFKRPAEFERVKLGAGVSFEVGRNERGECAVKCELERQD